MKEQSKSRDTQESMWDEVENNYLYEGVPFISGESGKLHIGRRVYEQFKISRVSGEPPKPDLKEIRTKAMENFPNYEELRNCWELACKWVLSFSRSGTGKASDSISVTNFEKVSGEAKTPEPTIQEIKNSMRQDYLDTQAKDNTVKEFTEMTAKHIMTFFYLMGLKSHIESMVVNQENGEEFIFSFQTVEYFKQRNKTELTGGSVPIPSDEERLWECWKASREFILDWLVSKNDGKTDAGFKEWLRGSTEQRLGKDGDKG